MHATVATSQPISPPQPTPAPFTFDDPLEPDLPGDMEVVTTRRAMCRVATVAAEAGARFQREASSVDPMAWMLAPRRMFDGASALEACLDRDHFVRAIVLHGLSLGVDADPETLERLVTGRDSGGTPRLSRPRRGRSGKRRSGAKGSLYCATICWEGDGVMLQAFHASVARHPAEVVQRLRARFGEDVIELAEVREGFHPCAPLAIALVPGAVAELLRTVERDSDAPRYATFCYDAEQRLEA
ncbi:hypothetical protein [uncultured Sphingomonas sp.]|uniref:hypothetical protein n=1 Tax=uncultured Sphingomonas sp. TaxID=158754 RepID=UPI0025E47976|nr:hypothetical protein [uncultured Sphingomonas sp.]